MTRILLFDVPQMLSDVVRAAVVGEPDLELVAELSDPEQLTVTIADQQPELVILRRDGELPCVVRALFDTRPRLRVLALSDAGERAFMWELAPRHRPLGEMSLDRLVATVRTPQEWSWSV